MPLFVLITYNSSWQSFSVFKNFSGFKYCPTRHLYCGDLQLIDLPYFTQGEDLAFLKKCTYAIELEKKKVCFFSFICTVKYALTRLMKEEFLPLQTVPSVICVMLSFCFCFVVAVGQTVNSRTTDILTHYQNLWRTSDFLHCQSYLLQILHSDSWKVMKLKRS